ncbi:IS21 family transposase [Paraburkholderia aspalathi]|uniref:IS21 family transposase n=1 Tax=Paraburkholderia aspalathi TaxID=1324617 RepID=UPI0019090C3C|nr:IS21 family transposase [Paraburkholderia aspalathi]MBK3844557.1 IS21 family transposase [Paraburkholderia aspalathi]
MSAEQRHGCLQEFLALTNGLSIAAVARTLRCCSRTIRNYVAGRSPIPWHRIEMLRLLALETSATQGSSCDGMTADETPVVANIEPDPAAPDVPPAELLAWVGVHAPHYLSSRRSFALYVRGWNVVEKIRRAKREGTFAAVLARWRTQAVELPRMWRSGRMFAGIGPPAYVHDKPAS